MQLRVLTRNAAKLAVEVVSHKICHISRQDQGNMHDLVSVGPGKLLEDQYI
jgi:hypothetical protein